ncbi:MAG: endolytic transglycosylase MltG [Pseudomonadota bacterium]|nr:endolytic transglycosylase MltG [Pseudomonadota bacterium]
MGRLAIRILLPIFIGVFLVGAVGAAWWGHERFAATGPLQRPVTMVIAKGAGPDSIAGLLRDGGVFAGIAAREIFIIGARLTDRARRMRAGEYEFSPGISMDDAITLLVDGKTVKRKLTIAEGLTTRQALALVAGAEGLTGRIPASPGEGALLPETYFFSHGDTRIGLVKRMAKARNDFLTRAWSGRAQGIMLKSRDEALILASIIEKETGRSGERARISAVFHNRLRRGMRLQSDPTVSYAITGPTRPLGRALTRRDLKTASPFNTYRVHGLPPTPIANPGRDSIHAALHPSKDRDLYFVADGKGGHAFARSLAQHNRNVAKWRRLKRLKK